MASFNDIGLSQPASSTITMKIATVTIDRNGTNTHQEILSLGDPDSSGAIAAVTNAAPNSTRYGVNVRIVGGPSTATDFAVRALLPSTAGDNPVSASQASTTWITQCSSLGGRVLVDQNSTTWPVQVSSVAGAVIVRSTAADLKASVYQSTYTDLNANVRLSDRDQATQTVAVLNATQPASTAYGMVVRLPAPITDSTNEALRVNVVAGAAGGSTLITVRQSTVGDLVVAAHGNQSSNSSVYLPVRLTNGTAFLSASQDYERDSTVASSAFGPTLMLRTGAPAYASTDTWEAVRGSTTGSLYAALTTDSGASIMDSTARAVRVTAAAPSASLLSTTVLVTSTHSTAIYPIISSAASVSHKVYAYFISSTHTNPSTIIFCSSASASGFDHWHVGLGSGSSGVTGANMAIAPPGFIFAGVSQNALNVKVEGGSSVTATAVVRVSVSYFSE